LELCLAFATLAERSFKMGHPKDAERNLANAEKGYSDISRFFSQATGITEQIEEERQSQFKLLRNRLAKFEIGRPTTTVRPNPKAVRGSSFGRGIQVLGDRRRRQSLRLFPCSPEQFFSRSVKATIRERPIPGSERTL